MLGESIAGMARNALVKARKEIQALNRKIQELQGLLEERQPDTPLVAIGAESSAATHPHEEKVSIPESLFRFVEHGAFIGAIGIIGPLMVPVSNWFLALPAACFALAFHRTGVVRGRSLLVQIPSYILLLFLGAAAGLGIHDSIKQTEEELLSRIAALIPKPEQPKVISAGNPPPPQTAAVEPKNLGSSVRPYDLPDERRNELLTLLAPPPAANALKIGCVGWSDRACAAAGKFVVLLSQAGWTINENRVFRMDTAIPAEGVSIISLPEPGPPLPPHLGRWHQMNPSEVTLMAAFAEMGLKYTGSSDASLPNGVTGVYFGPEPTALVKVDKQRLLYWQAVKNTYLISSIDQQNADDNATKAQKEARASSDIEHWLQVNFGKSVANRFHNLSGRDAKIKFLESIEIKITKSTPQ